MHRTFSRLVVAVVLVSLVLVPLSTSLAKSAPKGFSTTVTARDVRDAYREALAGGDTVRILIAPGHEPGQGGAVYQGVYEREIVTRIAAELAAELRTDPNVEVLVTRTDTAWSDALARYFDKHERSIKKFVEAQKKAMAKLVRNGDVETRGDGEQVDHAAAPTDVALRLYGINQWANENDIDLIVNLHVNDTTDHGPDTPSAHSGYAVYVPDSAFGNSDASRPLGEAIAKRLAALQATSTLPIENEGVVEDQELIAIGAYGTLDVPSVLIEYAYITEPIFTHPEVHAVVERDLAHKTYLGIEDYLGASRIAPYPSLTLPATWTASPTVGSSTPEAYALQAGLHSLGFYPTATSTLSSCPVSGFMDACTVAAIKAFQKSLSLEETGALGPRTMAALNARLGR